MTDNKVALKAFREDVAAWMVETGPPNMAAKVLTRRISLWSIENWAATTRP